MRRAAVAIVLAGTVALSLAACDPVNSAFNANQPPAPVAYTLVNGVPVVRACIPLTIEDIDITTYSSESDSEGTDVWEADGDVKVKAGQEFVLGSALSGETVETNKHREYLADDIGVDLSVDDVNGGYHDIFSQLSQGSFQEGAWLDGDGNGTSKPCSPGKCPSTTTGCTDRWHGIAAAEHPQPTIAPTGTAQSIPGVTTQVDPISFTQRDGAVYAELCAPIGANWQDLSPPPATSATTDGPTYFDSSTNHRSPAGTEWQLGKPLPGGKILDGGGQHFDFSKGVYSVSLMPSHGGIEIDGSFEASGLVEGKWLNSAGVPEASACADYKASPG